MRTSALVLIVVVFLCSCGSHTRQAGKRPEVKTTLRVENQNLLDMTIYILRGTQRIRLGLVNSFTTRVFVIPENLVPLYTSLRLLADPVGARETPVSQELFFSPGEEVEMVISN
ncbi:MAG: hypothetical protein ACE5NG_05900 [bacterium]